MYKCLFCEREFKNVGAKASHETSCKSNPDFKAPDKFVCEFCGKEFVGKSGINNHTKFCKDNPNRATRKEYTTKTGNVSTICQYCGKVCKNSNSHIQHELRCKQNPMRLPVNDFSAMYQSYSEDVKKRMNWNKGETKETNSSVLAYAQKLAGRPGPMLGKTFKRPQSANDKQSETRRNRIAEGKITPVTCHRYTNCYIKYQDGSTKFLRSSYELIVAMFLDICGVEFVYETIRAPYYDADGELHSFLGDFCVGNTVLEIKGDYDPAKLEQETKAFNAIGYELRIIHEEEVFYIRDLLQELFDIRALLKKVKDQSKNKNYYIYELSF